MFLKERGDTFKPEIFYSTNFDQQKWELMNFLANNLALCLSVSDKGTDFSH